jgi:hypothetical protein
VEEKRMFIAKADIVVPEKKFAALKYYLSNRFEGEPRFGPEPEEVVLAELKTLTDRDEMCQAAIRVLKELAA